MSQGSTVVRRVTELRVRRSGQVVPSSSLCATPLSVNNFPVDNNNNCVRPVIFRTATYKERMICALGIWIHPTLYRWNSISGSSQSCCCFIKRKQTLVALESVADKKTVILSNDDFRTKTFFRKELRRNENSISNYGNDR